ncbi:hypothetical protein SteCoe_23986 [Stentor coeruleus]|uniref:EF-hand domain-containing protein n=1 Tax=Stentor coeruleus TaxID=5963 RepID=A0A1R2BIN9_9CILI|nr:hypothetical protein SteCoe_23986 [Stentor coeruleus]
MLLEKQLDKLLPVRSAQSNLQCKLVKEAGNMRDGIDDVDLMTEDIINKALREVANSIMPDDTKSKAILDNIRKAHETVNEISPTNIPDVIDRVTKRLENWEKLERLRRELRERLSKEINRLKGEVQDRANELETAKATMEGMKTQFEAQLSLLQNAAEQHIALIEKLTQESSDKEKEISTLKNKVADLQYKNEEINEDLQRAQDEVDSNSKELRNLRRTSKDKDSEIRELKETLETLEMSTKKSSLDDKEKNDLFEKMKIDAKALKDELEAKAKQVDELEEKISKQDRENHKLDLELKNKEKENEAIKKEKAAIKAEVMKLETEKAEMEEIAKMNEGVNPEEIKQLERILEDKQKELDETEANLATAKRYQLLYLDLAQEKQENDEKLRELDIELSDLRRKIDEIKQENDQLKYKTRTLDQAQKDAGNLQKENQKLLMRLEFMEKSQEKPGETTEIAKKLAEEISNRDTSINDLKKQIEKLKDDLDTQKKKHETSLSRSFLVRLCHVFKEQEGQSFRKWRSYDNKAQSKLQLAPIDAAPALDAEEEAEYKQDYVVADQIISAENINLIEINPIMINFRTVEGKCERPMSYINVFKFLEELMDKKFETDKRDIADSRQLRSMTEFMMEYLSRTFGIQTLALKFLGQFIPGFHQIYSEKHKYAIFFARILQVFHPDPVTYSLAIYLVRLRQDFHPLIDKYDRYLTDQGKKKDLKKKGETYGRNSYEAAGTGGLALLTDVIDLIYTIFSGDRESGVKALELLKPEKVTHEDFVAFKICHKMAKLGKTPEMIFTILDKDGGGTIDSGEFLEGTKEDLDLWISDVNIKKLMMQMATTEYGEVTKDVFMERINMKALMNWNKNPDWAISKASFLISLVEVYKFKQRKLAAHLNPNYTKTGKSTLNKEEFRNIILDYDSTINNYDIDRLFDEANPDGNGVGFRNMVLLCSKYGLGELKAFRIRELMKELSERKLIMDVSLSENVTHLKSKGSFIVDDGRVEVEEEHKRVVKKKIVKRIAKK